MSWDWLSLSSSRLKSAQVKAPSPRAREPRPSGVIFDNLRVLGYVSKNPGTIFAYPYTSPYGDKGCVPWFQWTPEHAPPPLPANESTVLVLGYVNPGRLARICD